MSNHTNLTVREADDDGDGLNDEAVLHYQRVTEEEKKRSRATRGPLPGEATAFSGSAGLGLAAVAFDDRQLHAEVSGARRGDDPWGAEEDEYAVPAAVTGAEEDTRERRRQGGTGMAVRGSGTRGASQAGKGPMAAGAPMMGAPGATVGGVGAQGAPAGLGAMPQLGAAQNSAVGSMPVGLLQGAQSSSRAATAQVYSPPMSSGGLQAASAGPGAYDPELLREALKENGFMPDAERGADNGGGPGSELVDTNGDGIPDTPRSEVERAREHDPQRPPGGGFLPLPGGGGNQVAPGGSGPGSYGPGGSGPGGSGPGNGGYQPPRGPSYPGPTSPVPTNPGGPTGPTNPGYPPTTSNPGPGSQTGPGQNGGWQPPTSTGPVAADGSSTSNAAGGPGFSQATPTYTGSGGSGYSVTPEDLRRDSREWAAVSDQSAPIVQAIISTPPPAVMFGHMSAPISTYRAAVQTAQEHVEESGEQSLTVSVGLNETAANFDEQELAAIAETGRMI